MKKLVKFGSALVLGGGLLLGGLGMIHTDPTVAQANAAEKKERHPHIRQALSELREARKELKEAAHDFGGHRKEAVEAVNVAIKQLEIALKYDKN
jgi:hypothetical protein